MLKLLKFSRMKRFIHFLIVVFFLGSAIARGYEIDVKKYFSFYKIPDRYAGAVTTFSPYVFLSKEKCQAKGVHKSYDAKMAISVWLPSRTRHECWSLIKNDIVLLCPVGESKTDQIGTACVQISKSRFSSTDSLPKAANFGE